MDGCGAEGECGLDLWCITITWGTVRAMLVIGLSCVNANAHLPRGLVVPCAPGSL